MKRPSPSRDTEQDGHTVKKMKRCHHTIGRKQVNAVEALQGAQDDFVFQGQLLRAVALQLSAAGFDSATPGALEALRAQTEQYILHLLSSVCSSMHANRRIAPSPQDFASALAQQGIRSSSLKPLLKLSAPHSITQPELEILPPEPQVPPPLEPILGTGLSGEAEKNNRSYIPSHLPNLPSRHTWQSTPRFTTRETDPRKIRERATEEGVLAEQALRKLMAARTAGRQAIKASSWQSEATRKRDEIWERTMNAVFKADEEDQAADDDEDMDMGMDDELPLANRNKVREADAQDDGLVVNYEQKYWRQSAQVRH